MLAKNQSCFQTPILETLERVHKNLKPEMPTREEFIMLEELANRLLS